MTSRKKVISSAKLYWGFLQQLFVYEINLVHYTLSKEKIINTKLPILKLLLTHQMQ